jgi:hypothetical protein
VDNGILSCDDPRRLRQLADALDARKIDLLLRRWLQRLPHPFEAKVCVQGDALTFRNVDDTIGEAFMSYQRSG